MPLLQLRDETTLEKRDRRQARHRRQCDGNPDGTRPALDGFEHADVARLQPPEPAAFPVHDPRPGKGQQAQRGRHRQGNEQRGAHGGEICHPERGEQTPRHPAEGQHRDERQPDGPRGEDHRAAHFQGRREDDLPAGPGVRADVAVQAAEDIFHVDHGVIDHFPQRDGQPAERHDVQRDAATHEQPDGGQ